jgi:hypothetical protein
MPSCRSLYQRHKEIESGERRCRFRAVSFARWWPDQALIRINTFIVFRPQSCFAKLAAGSIAKLANSNFGG